MNPIHPPAALLEVEDYPAPDFKIQVANWSIFPVCKQVLFRNSIGDKSIEETFMILPTMGNILNGMSFFKKYSVTFDLTNNIVKFPDITLQLKPEHGQYRIQMIELRTSQNTVIPPDQHLFVPVLAEKHLCTAKGTVEAFPSFDRKIELLVSRALVQISEVI